jgi:hypothetical protein
MTSVEADRAPAADLELDLSLVARLAVAENQREAVRQLRDALRAR